MFQITWYEPDLTRLSKYAPYWHQKSQKPLCNIKGFARGNM